MLVSMMKPKLWSDYQEKEKKGRHFTAFVDSLTN
jgi:hypothetical protein